MQLVLKYIICLKHWTSDLYSSYNDLRFWPHVRKFIDDTILSEVIPKSSDSDMQHSLDAVLEWSH